MRDLTLIWQNCDKFGEFSISISAFIVFFYSCTPHLGICKPTQCVNDYILSYRQDRHKISTAATCLWNQETSIFKLNTVSCYRKPEHKMAAAQTGNTYISACTIDRNTIPNPKTMFSTTGFSMMILWTLFHVTGSRNPRWWPSKTEIHISKLVH